MDIHQTFRMCSENIPDFQSTIFLRDIPQTMDIPSNIPRSIPRKMLRNICNSFPKNNTFNYDSFASKKQNDNTYEETFFKLKKDIQWISIKLLKCVQKIFLTCILPFFEGYPSKK